MMNWKVAPSYKNAKILSVNEETHKAQIEEVCDRCGGRGIIAARVENGQIIPIPVDGGICYKCGGSGKVKRIVKAYTPAEYDSYVKAQERVKQRKADEQMRIAQERSNNSEQNKREALSKLGYDCDTPIVYIVGGENTYSIKDQLKAAGCYFTPALGWYSSHSINLPDDYTLIQIKFDDLFEWWPATKKFSLKEGARSVAEAAKKSIQPVSASEYVGAVKERLRDMKVVLVSARQIDGFYGTSTI